MLYLWKPFYTDKLSNLWNTWDPCSHFRAGRALRYQIKYLLDQGYITAFPVWHDQSKDFGLGIRGDTGSPLDSWSSGLGSSPGRGHLFWSRERHLSRTVRFSSPRCIKWVQANLKLGKRLIQSHTLSRFMLLINLGDKRRPNNDFDTSPKDFLLSSRLTPVSSALLCDDV